jgi:uncharacterized phage protein (TIGR02218 family)
MKVQTDEYVAREQASEIEAYELFHAWSPATGEHWRKTSHDRAVTYKGDLYEPATVDRSSVKYDSQLDVSTLQVSASVVTDPFVNYIASNPIEPVWIEVLRIHRSLSEASVVFIGQIRGISVQGSVISADCVGFEYFLKQTVPIMRIQPGCNYSIYQPIVDGRGCGVDRSLYKITTTVIPYGRVLFSDDFSSYEDGYFVRGWIVFGRHKRMIVAQSGSSVEIRYDLPDLEEGDEVDVYPGCDGQILTCFNKFNNAANFGGHPFVPKNNPATAMS